MPRFVLSAAGSPLVSGARAPEPKDEYCTLLRPPQIRGKARYLAAGTGRGGAGRNGRGRCGHGALCRRPENRPSADRLAADAALALALAWTIADIATSPEHRTGLLA